MKNKFEHAKNDVILIISIMTLLFTLCMVLYTDTFLKDVHMDIETRVELNGGKEISSAELQDIIPYLDIRNKKYITAYQDKKTTIEDIHNGIILATAYSRLSSSEFSGDSLLTKINYLYGNNIFIVNDSFVIDDKNTCSYYNEEDKYICNKVNYNGIIYKAKRDITNISISSNKKAYLTESIIFYSIEKDNGDFIIRVYKDGTYNQQIAKFINKGKENVDLDNYLNNNDYKTEYISTFKLTDNHYIWESTEVKK